eukprot:1144232-Pelagomonas_calceolata.AAC.2
MALGLFPREVSFLVPLALFGFKVLQEDSGLCLTQQLARLMGRAREHVASRRETGNTKRLRRKTRDQVWQEVQVDLSSEGRMMPPILPNELIFLASLPVAWPWSKASSLQGKGNRLDCVIDKLSCAVAFTSPTVMGVQHFGNS